MLPRRWGRGRASSWCATAERPEGAIGEIWQVHPLNVTAAGVHLGAEIARDPRKTLGELGRAPPSLRLLITDEPSDPLSADAPVALWRILESPLDGAITLYEDGAARPRQVRARRDDLLRVPHAARLVLPAGMTALEARANFASNNQPSPERARRLLAASERKHRNAWLRDPAMSVELWTLPEVSFLEPDGETCHVIMALTPGVSIDGEALSRGDALLLPAQGRRVVLTGRGDQIVVAYPDLIPTSIWKLPHAPKPAALAMDPALAQSPVLNAAAGFAPAMRAAA
jgi:hypothetical protein